MGRRDVLISYQDHAIFGRLWKRLIPSERDFAHSFINSHDNLSKKDFEYAVNRAFLDLPNKPKHWKEILELLACTNSALP
jgi:hypothetical protein